jgi:glycosyltransferase involved in cell wall biosynthesis
MSVKSVENQRPLLILGVTSAASTVFFRSHFAYLERAGFDVMVLSSPGEQLDALAREGVATATVAMRREISLAHDFISLFRLWRLLKTVRPSIVEFGTPKAGLLGIAAAWLACVSCRIYTIHGLRLETTKGLKRAVLMCTERLSCLLANRVLCVSESLCKRVVELRIAPKTKTTVLGNGSRTGVDVERFSPTVYASAEVLALRDKLALPLGSSIIGFVGRFVRDKGIHELVEAFRQLHGSHPDVRLLLVGDFEESDPIDPEVRRFLETTRNIVRTGFVADIAPYYGLMDVLVLPTYREGFPQVSLEAQASGVPVVTTTATGAIDSVVDGVTGVLVPVGDSVALAAAIHKLLVDPELRTRMGRAGRERMNRNFLPTVVWDAHVRLYRELMEEERAHKKSGFMQESV